LKSVGALGEGKVRIRKEFVNRRRQNPFQTVFEVLAIQPLRSFNGSNVWHSRAEGGGSFFCFKKQGSRFPAGRIEYDALDTDPEGLVWEYRPRIGSDDEGYVVYGCVQGRIGSLKGGRGQ